VRTVGIAELKNRLSYYILRLVQRGESILVCDRDRVIARIERVGADAPLAGGDAAWLERLERRGAIRRGTGRFPADWLDRMPSVGADHGSPSGAGRGSVRFWDSSAMVPLLVKQEASPRVRAWMTEDHPISPLDPHAAGSRLGAPAAGPRERARLSGTRAWPRVGWRS
jgi:antitoxin (DNA-binding transcriptional repressor) of toxin-antitoxin stability system